MNIGPDNMPADDIRVIPDASIWRVLRPIPGGLGYWKTEESFATRPEADAYVAGLLS